MASVAAADAEEEVFDRIQDALTASALDGQVRGRLSGTLDLEAYTFQAPAPALLQTSSRSLFSPRLALFLDAQLGQRAYVFAQARVDRGFDPAATKPEIRLDEYALRVSPWHDARLQLQVGRFATVVGNWTARHTSWANPFVTAPLPYENLTGVWDTEAIRSSNVLLQWSHVRPGLPAALTAVEKSLRLPIIWGPSYATGLAVAGDVNRFRYAFEVKHAALSSRPEAWTRTRGAWRYPTWSGRVGYRAGPMWNFGVSASAGSYLRPFAKTSLGVGRNRGDYRQVVLAQDVSFAWRHFQLWSEVYLARFEIPGVGDARTAAYYVEAKYKFTPRFFGAVRWNEQLFGHIPDRAGRVRWGHDVQRVDLAAGFRFTAHTQLKIQYNRQEGDRPTGRQGQLLAAQLTTRF